MQGVCLTHVWVLLSLGLAVQEEGLSCVFTRCMGDCNEAVPDAWFQSLLPKALAEKHRRFLLFSFVEHNQCV